MNAKEQAELWRWAVHNRAFEVQQALDEIRSTFMALSGPKVMLHDKYSVAERQLRICELEAKNLITAITHIDFKPPETPPDET